VKGDIRRSARRRKDGEAMDAALRRPLRLNWLSFGRPTFVRAQLGAKPRMSLGFLDHMV
jgi:hypothetical protein